MTPSEEGQSGVVHTTTATEKKSATAPTGRANSAPNISQNLVTLFPRITVTKNGKDIPIGDVLSDIQNGKYAANTAKVRKHEKGTADYRESKNSSPYFTASGTFTERNDKGLKKHSGLAAIDIDRLEDANELKALVCADPFVYSAFVSIGGKGLCVLVRIDPNRHKESFAALKEYYHIHHGQKPDNTQDFSRSRFVSYDPDIYINDEATIFAPEKVKVKEATTAEVESVSEEWTDEEQITFAEKLTQKRETYQDGNRHNYIRQLTSFCIRLGVPQSALESHVWTNYPDFAKEPTNIIKWAYKGWYKDFGTWKKPKKYSSQNGVSADPQIEPTATAKKAQRAKQWLKKNNYDIRFNAITQLYELNGKSLTDREINTLYLGINGGGIKAGKELVRALIESNETREYNPLTDFFDSNKLIKPSGKISALAASVEQGTYTPEFWELLLTKWMVGAVAALEPGKRNILELVLQGDQKTGKSYFLEYILPNELNEYFASSRLDGEKDADILICQKFLIVDDEYGGKSKLDAKRHKELISKRFVTVRLPYGRHPVKLHRVATFAGTTNDENILSDPTGNRRVIPVKVLSRDFAAYDAIDKKELWMEAYHLAKSGFDYELTKEEITQLNVNTGEFQNVTIEGEHIFKHIGKPEDHETMQDSYLTTADILTYLNRVSNTRRGLNPRAIGIELKAQGFNRTTKRVRKMPYKVWHVVKLTPESLPPLGL